MKRVLSTILALAMAASLISCGSGGGTSSGTTAPPPSGGTSAQTPSGGGAGSGAGTGGEADITSWILEDDTNMSGTVRFWVPFTEEQGMGDMIKEFNSVYPNIKVELNTYNNNSDGNLSVNTAIMSNQVDVLASFSIANTYRRWENGLYQDLTGKVKEENIDLIANWGTDVYTYDGRIYTLPSGGRSIFIGINMDKWNAAGLGELPKSWTWDEYMAACEKMTERDANGKVTVYGGSDFHTTSFYTYAYSQVTGGAPYYDVDTGLSSFGSEIQLKALERKLKAERVDEIWFPNYVYRSDNLQAQQTYTTGQTASSINTNLVRFIRDTEHYPMTWKTGFAPYPVEEAGQTNYMGGIAHFSHTGITTGCQDEDAAWAFLKWYSTYGSKYLIIAGHQSTWKGTDLDDLVSLVFGSREAAEKLIDVDSFYNAVVNYDSPVFTETVLTAYSEVNSAIGQASNAAVFGELDAAAALAQAQQEADDAIKEEL